MNPSYFFTRDTNSNTDIFINEASVLKHEDQQTFKLIPAITFEKRISDSITGEENKNRLTHSEFKTLSSGNFTNHENLLDLVP